MQNLHKIKKTSLTLSSECNCTHWSNLYLCVYYDVYEVNSSDNSYVKVSKNLWLKVIQYLLIWVFGCLQVSPDWVKFGQIGKSFLCYLAIFHCCEWPDILKNKLPPIRSCWCHLLTWLHRRRKYPWKLKFRKKPVSKSCLIRRPRAT